LFALDHNIWRTFVWLITFAMALGEHSN
jgi:hypothetical protein